MRLKIVRIIFSMLFLVVIAGLAYTQVIRGFYFYSLSKENSIRVVPVEGPRGLIKDRNGVVLADNRLSFDVTVVPQDVEDKEEIFAYLSSVLKIEKTKIAKLYRARYTAPFSPVIIAKDVSKETAFALEENTFLYPGLAINVNLSRYYPYKEINAHLLGYVGKINRSKITELKDYGYTMQSIVGYSGVEEYYDSYLKEEGGGLQVEVNNRGEQMRLLGSKESVSGQDVTLTVDNRIQVAAMESLEGKTGAVIVMDLETGEILSMVSLPSFDPNYFVEGRNEISAFFSDPLAPLLNRAISGQYPPGSTFKIPVTFAALESKKITPHTTFSCPGYYLLGNRSFQCSHVHGLQDLFQGIAHSCNVYFFNTGLLVGPELITKYARKFGLGDLTHIDLPYEAKGLIPDQPQRNKRWHKGDILNVSIGQGDILATPLQLVEMIAMVARDGKGLYPHILKAIGPEEVQTDFSPLNAEISKEALTIVKEGLRGAVADEAGTARVLNMEDIPVYGKTGTAQTSGGKAHHAWFIGYCPTTKTKIAFCVFLEHGGSSYNACIVAKNLLLKMKEQEML